MKIVAADAEQTTRQASAVGIAAVEEQSAATSEIARNVQQTAAGTSNVNGNIGGGSDAAAGTGAAAQQVLGSAQGLASQALALRGEVGNFLNAVRAS